MKITVELPISLHVGILHYNNLESGFWQLKEDGIDYNLINLPENFQMEGVKVAVLLKKILDEVAGSIKIPKNYKNKSISFIIKDSKKKYFTSKK
jgi:hypothetical protein